MSGPTVLVVDDNLLNLELVGFVLAADGWQVLTAVDATAALHSLSLRQPDLILMDIQLPGMDGLALTRLLKAQPATRAIPIVAFTAYAMKGDELRMRSAGCEAYVSKPVDVTTLAARLRSHLPQTG
jgi:two-component system, cell cycle response regulator DivK